MKVRIVLSMLVLTLGLLALTDAQGQIITSVVRSGGASGDRPPIGAFTGETQCLPMEPGGVKDGNLIRSDRDTHRFVNTPTGTLGPLNMPLIGSEYVRTFNNDKDSGGENVTYTVTTSMRATIWIAMDDRWNETDRQARVDQVAGRFALYGTFKDTQLNLYVGGDSDRAMSVYAAEFDAGTYVFGPQQGNNFYIIGAVLADTTFNPAPVVNAQPDVTVAVYLEDSVQIGGTVTDRDPLEGDPGVLSCQWSKLSGPGDVTFGDAQALETTATFSATGAYVLQLAASDGSKDANDIVNVLVRDHADDKMIAHWDFEVTTGPHDVMDSLHNNHGAFMLVDSNSVAPTYVPGWIGSNALRFDGTSYALISIDSNSVPNFNDEPRWGASLSAWIKVDAFDTDWQTAVSRGDDSWRIARTYRDNDNRNAMAFHVSGTVTNPNNGPSGTISVNDGNWHHVAGTYDGKVIRLYIDGVLDVTQPAIGPVNLSSNPIVLGGQIHNNEVRRLWKGLLDDVRVYNYGLSEAEVLALTAMNYVRPMVNAGPDMALQYRPGEKVSLNGTVIDKGKQGPITITWATVTSPNGPAVFDDPSSPVTQVSFPAFGVYELSLTAQNSYQTVTDTIRIEVISPTCADVIAEGKLMPGDVSGPDGTPDCRIDLFDFVKMAQDWLRCNDPRAVECEYPY